jgi:hypothetical protein
MLEIAAVGKLVVMIAEVKFPGDADLAELGTAGRGDALVFGATESGQEEGSQDGDDGDDDQQFDEGEGTSVHGHWGRAKAT